MLCNEVKFIFVSQKIIPLEDGLLRDSGGGEGSRQHLCLPLRNNHRI